MKDLKILLGIVFATLILLFGGVFLLNNKNSTSQIAGAVDVKLLVREDSFQTALTSAKVTIVEFADFSCPACALSNEILNSITKDYAGKVNIVFRHFPLPTHINSKTAAEAVEAAGEQGKYLEMQDKLYKNQSEWSNIDNPLAKFLDYAKELNLDINKFEDSVKNNSFAAKIERDKNDGNLLGVNSTPTFFINGKKQLGIGSLDQFKNIINEQLNK